MPHFYSPPKVVESTWRGIVAGLVSLIIFFDPVAVLLSGTDKDVPGISIQQVKKMLYDSNVIIIDVRRPRNWWRSTKKILTSVRENPSEVNQWAPHYPRDKSLIFYCA